MANLNPSNYKSYDEYVKAITATGTRPTMTRDEWDKSYGTTATTAPKTETPKKDDKEEKPKKETKPATKPATKPVIDNTARLDELYELYSNPTTSSAAKEAYAEQIYELENGHKFSGSKNRIGLELKRVKDKAGITGTESTGEAQTKAERATGGYSGTESEAASKLDLSNPDTKQEEADTEVEAPKAEDTKELTWADVKALCNDDPEKIAEWLNAHPDYKAGEKTTAGMSDLGYSFQDGKWTKSGEQTPAAENGNGTPAANNNQPSGNPAGTPEGANSGANSGAKTEEQQSIIKKLFDAWKSGKLDMYPTLKAIIDTMAKQGEMSADRAAILTGGTRDMDAYKPIETETDKVRDIQRESTANFDATAMNADKWSQMTDEQKENWIKMANNGGITFEQMNTMLSKFGERPDKIYQWLNNEYTKHENETQKSTLEVKNMSLTQKQMAQSNLSALMARRTELETLKNSLAGNDWDTYVKAMNAYVGTSKGLQTMGVANTSISTEDNSQVHTLNESVKTGKLPGKFVDGSLSNDNTWNSGTSTSESGTNTLSTDALALSRFKDGEAYANADMATKNAANEQLKKEIDSEIAVIDQCIASWKDDLGMGGE